MTWREDAACLGADPDLFFSESSGRVYEQAREICDRCEVRLPCLTFALDTGMRLGLWGGTTPKQRRGHYRDKSEAISDSGLVGVL